jgi:hypothetical protein
MLITKDGRPIVSLEDWFIRAGPRVDQHWKDGSSSKETARAWLAAAPYLPLEVEGLLAGNSHFGAPKQWKVEPESKFRFDEFPGDARDSSLLIRAVDEHGEYVIAVEGKADEPYGETVADALGMAMERKLSIPRSNGILRVEQLCTALLGPRCAGEAALGDLRYPLLTAAAGAIWEAERQGKRRAVLLIHEFVTNHSSDRNHQGNAEDLDRFVHRLSHGAQLSVPTGQLIGPIIVPGAPLLAAGTHLFIGKVMRNLRTSTYVAPGAANAPTLTAVVSGANAAQNTTTVD